MRKKAYRYTKDDYVFVYQMLVLRSKGLSYPKIGKMFNKDHTTIIHWCKRFNVDVGSQVPVFDGRVFRNTQVEEPEAYKYKNIIEEPINRGRLRYSDYLRS
jgi:transposase